MDDQAKAIHAYLQICFVTYPFFSFFIFTFYFLLLSRRYNFLFLYFSFSLSLSLILLSWILTTHILHLVALSTHVCIKIYYYNEATNVRLAFYFFVVTYLYIFLCTFTERYMSKKMDQYELYVCILGGLLATLLCKFFKGDIWQKFISIHGNSLTTFIVAERI